MDPALWALVGTLFGGAGMKIVEAILSRRKGKDDLATSLRNELRADIATLRADLKEESRESEEWKAKYYEAAYSSRIANHKVDAVISVVDDKHPAAGLKADLEELIHPDK